MSLIYISTIAVSINNVHKHTHTFYREHESHKCSVTSATYQPTWLSKLGLNTMAPLQLQTTTAWLP
jgi:hypothetical protein